MLTDRNILIGLKNPDLLRRC